jgi:hypothetical protein
MDLEKAKNVVWIWTLKKCVMDLNPSNSGSGHHTTMYISHQNNKNIIKNARRQLKKAGQKRPKSRRLSTEVPAPL